VNCQLQINKLHADTFSHVQPEFYISTNQTCAEEHWHWPEFCWVWFWWCWEASPDNAGKAER